MAKIDATSLTNQNSTQLVQNQTDLQNKNDLDGGRFHDDPFDNPYQYDRPGGNDGKDTTQTGDDKGFEDYYDDLQKKYGTEEPTTEEEEKNNSGIVVKNNKLWILAAIAIGALLIIKKR